VKHLRSTASAVFAGVLLLAVCHTRTYSQESGLAPGSGEEVVLVGAGDIAKCDMIGGAHGTARLLDKIPGTIFTVGDNAYDSGSAEEFEECYTPTWGRHRARTRPAPGNHDVRTDHGRPYYEYFGDNAGPEGRGYYSYDLGSWHIISLNSEGDMRAKSSQGRWLQEDLKANPSECILAYWHRPRFSSGPHGSNRKLHDFWRLLYEAGADIVLSGHDHDYERFAPQNPKGKADPKRGIRQFVVGTGGGGVYQFKRPRPNSEIRDNSTYGVLKLTLGPGRYQWEFVPVTVGKFSDSGSGTCSPTP
jgi:3',5'-cyclic AMP phosphodiesterase CpdA